MTKVQRLWPNSTVVILASGSSLTPADAAYARKKADVVIAINRTYEMAPDADVLYGSDPHRFWTWHKGVPSFTGLKYTVWSEPKKREIADALGIATLERTGHEGLDTDPGQLRTGHNSAYAAVNLAVHLGASKIVLLGVDLQAGPKRKVHWHEDTVTWGGPPFPLCLQDFATIVQPLRDLGVTVINCTRRTALTVFPQASLETVL